MNETISNIDLSVVVLGYGARETIVPFTERLKTLLETVTPNYEIVIVANYFVDKDDDTRAFVKSLSDDDSRITAVIKEKKGMMGWDMHEGMSVASGKYICIIDGDGQFPIQHIKTGYDLITSKNLDFIKTYRQSRNDGPYRITISWVYNILLKFLFPGMKCNDANSKPKIIKKSAYDKMKLYSNDWFADAEIMINVRRFKLSFEEFPTEFFEIEDRQSFVKPTAIIEFLINLLKFRIKEFFV